MTGIKIHSSFKEHVKVEPSLIFEGVRNIRIMRTLGCGFSATVSEPLGASDREHELHAAFYSSNNTSAYSMDKAAVRSITEISKADFDDILDALVLGDAKALKDTLAKKCWLPDVLGTTTKKPKAKAKPRKIIEQFDLFAAGVIA